MSGKVLVMTAERPARVGERIRAELMEMLLLGQLKDPGTQGAVVHAVKVTGDLRHAKVYVRLGQVDPPQRAKEGLMRGLERAKGFLRRQIGDRLGLRHAPELTFLWDDTTDRAGRIDAILDEIAKQEEE